MVLDYIRKGFKMGLRAAEITEKEAKDFAKEIVSAGIITAKESEAFAKEILDSGRLHKKNVEAALKKKVGPRIKKYGSKVKSELSRTMPKPKTKKKK